MATCLEVEAPPTFEEGDYVVCSFEDDIPPFHGVVQDIYPGDLYGVRGDCGRVRYFQSWFISHE
jgi:hypothetical protein